MKRACVLSLAVLLTVLFLNSYTSAAAKRLPIKSQTISISNQVQLFLDDTLIDWRFNVVREMQQPVKNPANPVIIQDQPWEKRALQVYGTVLYDPQGQVFRCWYLGSENPTAIPDTPEAPGTAEYYQCYAESKDGIHWEKPLIGFGPYGPHQKTNIVIDNSSGFCVLPTPGDPDSGKKFRGVGGAIFGYSADGIHWTTQAWQAVGKNDTSTSMVFWKGEYLAFVRTQEEDHRAKGNLQRAVGLCTSMDFEHWTYKQTILMTDKQDGFPWVQPYGMAVTLYGDQLIGLIFMLYLDPVLGNNALGDMNIQMATSRDGRAWARVADRAVFLEGSKDAWDCRIMCPATPMFVKDDMVYIYYSGANARHGDKQSKCMTSIGLATLPADRFVALQPENPEKEAVLETYLLQFTGNELILNVETQPDGLHVELVDPHGFVVEGFDRSACKLTQKDPLRYRVTWNTPAGEKTVADARTLEPLALRFILSNQVKLFAFSIQ